MTTILATLIPAAFIAGAIYGCRRCRMAESQIRALAAKLEECERRRIWERKQK
jgi:hypothetical protein